MTIHPAAGSHRPPGGGSPASGDEGNSGAPAHIGASWSARLDAVTDGLPTPAQHLIRGMLALVARNVDLARSEFDAAELGGLEARAVDEAVEALVLSLGLSQWTTAAWQALPKRPADVQHPVAAAIRDHFARTQDDMPAPVEALAADLPALAALYLATRESVIGADAGLNAELRELLLSIFSAQAGYIEGGLRHLRRAQEGGLSIDAIRTALACAVLVGGASTWRAYGEQLWTAAADYKGEQEPND